jgi:hypothetical protein
MLTTRDLKLRQKEVLKNIDETYRQIIRQPVGGLGALIQKSDNPPQKRPFVPTIFTPAPMTSSLPYLADWVKQRSNENILMLSAHIAKQKEVAKASFFDDAVKRAEYQERLEDNMIIRNQVEPSGRDLMNRFLAGEIQKRKREEYVMETLRRDRVDLEINPVIPVTPIARRPDAIGVGDLGARVEEQPTRVESLRSSIDRPDVEGRLRGILERAKGLLPKKSFRSELDQATKELESRVENQYSRSELKGEMNRLRKLNFPLPPSKDIQSKPGMAEQLVKAKKQGKIEVNVLAPVKKRSTQVVTAEEPSRAVGGGTVGGSALASLIKGNLE